MFFILIKSSNLQYNKLFQAYFFSNQIVYFFWFYVADLYLELSSFKFYFCVMYLSLYFPVLNFEYNLKFSIKGGL